MSQVSILHPPKPFDIKKIIILGDSGHAGIAKHSYKEGLIPLSGYSSFFVS